MKCYVNPYEGDQDFLFFSYCHDDEADVYPIIERLALEGYRVWYDDGIHPGDDWPDVIAEHLSRAKVCAAAISKASVESHNCRNEVSFAIANNKPIIALILQDFPMPMGIRLQLSSSNFIRKYEHSDEEFYEKLILSPAASSCKNNDIRASSDQLAQWREHVLEYQMNKKAFAEESVKAASASGWFPKKDKNPEPTARTADEARPTREAEERKRKEEEDAAREAEEARLAREDEERRRREEEDAARKAEEAWLAREAEERRRRDEEDAARKAEEARLAREAEERRRKEEEDAARKAEEVRLAREAEERRRREEEARQHAYEEPDNEESTVYEPEDETIIEDQTPTEDTIIPAFLFRIKTGKFYSVKKSQNILGRSKTDADLIIEGNPGISRKHAEIIREGYAFSLRQISEKNTTEVNGEALKWDQTVPLPECSELLLGSGPNKEQFLLVYGSACDCLFDEQKLCILKSKDTEEIKLLSEQVFPLDRHHQWGHGVLGDKQISREKHAVIERKSGRLYLRDIGSKAGTTCNGKRLEMNESVELHHGDTISIANTKFDYQEFTMTGA